MKVRLRLVYPAGYVDKPILAEAVLATGVKLNIMEASMNAMRGELVVSVEEERSRIEELIRFLRQAGLTVETIGRVLRVNGDKCIDCGACVSLCPVQAIMITEDWRVRFDENRCVGCGVCVKACPMKAITLL